MNPQKGPAPDPSSTWDFRDFSLNVRTPPPVGYPADGSPELQADPFVEEAPDWNGASAWAASYEMRREAYLRFCAARPAPPILKAPFYELPRAAAGQSVHEGILAAGLDYIEDRRDCSDFLAHAYIRLLLAPGLSKGLSPASRERVASVLADFKYWPDEPGADSLCTWTENHQILYASAALVLGQAWPGTLFANSGRTGAQQAERARPRVLRWLDLRFRTGFSEWLSNVYYDEDLAALLTLADFADPEVAARARSVVDLLFLDLALHTCRGVFGCSHGRGYADQKKDARKEAVSDSIKLAFGIGCYGRNDNMAAICLALSRTYSPPPAIAAIASTRQTAVIRQRMGIRVDEAARWALGYDSLEDGMVFLGLEAYNHPRTIELTFRLLDAYRWWDNDYFAPFRRHRNLIGIARKLGLMPLVARAFDWDINRNAREEVDLYTCRTPDYSLSSAQDWCFRRGGDQQSLWQATLGAGAVCFTTHPGGKGERSPGYWTGSGSLPRVAQHRNVLFALYDIVARPGLYHTDRLLFTHAWFPKESFDETTESGPWYFARRGKAYIALASGRPARWQRDDGQAGAPNELVAHGRKNAWVCRLGREAEDGSFAGFVRAIAASPLDFIDQNVHFRDPSHGQLEFGPHGPLLVAGREQELHGYPRYDSPWGTAPFPAGEVRVDCGGERMVIRPEGHPAPKRGPN